MDVYRWMANEILLSNELLHEDINTILCINRFVHGYTSTDGLMNSSCIVETDRQTQTRNIPSMT